MRIFLSISVLILCQALITEFSVESDPRSVFIVQSFGYLPGGHFALNIKDFEIRTPVGYAKTKEDFFDISFILQHSQLSVQPGADPQPTDEQGNRVCYHDLRMSEEDVLFQMSSTEDWASSTFTQTITEPGFYHLYFSNCEFDTRTSFKLSLVEYNIDEEGNRDYLSVGRSVLPMVYFILCGCFAVELIVWLVFVCRFKKDAKRIHYLMGVVITMKVLALFFESYKMQALKTTGTDSAWAVPFYIFSFLKGMLMFSVIILIGTGWSYLKPFLTEKDKQIMVIVIVIQFIVNIAAIVLDEEAPGQYSFLTWKDILHLADLVCCCMILLPIVHSIQHLKDAAQSDGKAQQTLNRLKNFRSFYLLVVCYVYFTRIIVFLMDQTLTFERTWIGNVCAEVATLLFFVCTGYMFRPQPRNPYLALGGDDDDEFEGDVPFVATNMRDDDSDDDFFEPELTPGVQMTELTMTPNPDPTEGGGKVGTYDHGLRADTDSVAAGDSLHLKEVKLS